MKEFVQSIAPDKLTPFAQHPFRLREDAAMDELTESVRAYGVLSPLLARPRGEGYELVSGHRRRAAALKLGLHTVPVLVREMSDDEAVILMVDSNLQRENLLPSEKAFAYKMKLAALKHQGKATSRQLVGKPESADCISERESGRTVQRYIRLTNLVKPLLDMVDEGRIAFSPAVELSYLTREQQAYLLDSIEQEDATPSLSQAIRIAAREADAGGYLRRSDRGKAQSEGAGAHQDGIAAQILSGRLLRRTDGAGNFEAAGGAVSRQTPRAGEIVPHSGAIRLVPVK